MKKIIIMLLLVVIGVGILFSNQNNVSAYTPRSYNGSIYELDNNENGTYKTYVNKQTAVFPNEVVDVDLTLFEYENGLVENDVPYYDSFQDDLNVRKDGLYIPESGDITFSLNVEKAGYYHIGLEYYSILGRSSNIERSIKINGVY